VQNPTSTREDRGGPEKKRMTPPKRETCKELGTTEKNGEGRASTATRKSRNGKTKVYRKGKKRTVGSPGSSTDEGLMSGKCQASSENVGKKDARRERSKTVVSST